MRKHNKNTYTYLRISTYVLDLRVNVYTYRPICIYMYVTRQSAKSTWTDKDRVGYYEERCNEGKR
jgi:hypothetical protein